MRFARSHVSQVVGLAVALTLVITATVATAQVVTQPNQIQTSVRFTNVNPEIVSYLSRATDVPPGEGRGLTSFGLSATSLPPQAPTLSH